MPMQRQKQQACRPPNKGSLTIWIALFHGELVTLELVDKATQASLRQIIMAIPDPDCPEQ